MTDRSQQTFFTEIVGQDNVTGIVGVAPLALVVVLVVGRSDMPALIQSHGVVLIAGIVAARADLTFAVADFHKVDTSVNNGIPVGEVDEGAEGGAGMVELADGVNALRLAQQLVVCLQAGVIGLFVKGFVVTGDNAGRCESVDMTRTAGPCHFKAGDCHQSTGIAFIESFHGALIGAPLALAGRVCEAHVIQRALGVCAAARVAAVKVVGMVSESNELHVSTFG